MKKRILILAAAILFSFTALFANTGNAVPAHIVNELHDQFSNATQVEWQTTETFYKATFVIEGHQLKAFYSLDGEQVAVSRAITPAQLPMALMKDLKQKSESYEVTELFELLTNKGTEYYVQYTNDNDTKTYRSTGDFWSRY